MNELNEAVDAISCFWGLAKSRILNLEENEHLEQQRPISHKLTSSSPKSHTTIFPFSVAAPKNNLIARYPVTTS